MFYAVYGNQFQLLDRVVEFWAVYGLFIGQL